MADQAELAVTTTQAATEAAATTAAATTTETTITPEAKAAAEAAETARVAALTPEQKQAEADAAKKTADDKAAADKKADDAPADYTALKLPDGYKADDPVFAEAVKLFGDEKISPASAQKLMDFTVERDKAIAKAVNDANAAAWTKTQGEWKATAEKTHSAEDLGIAKTAMAKIFDKDTLTLLESWGLTNHPGVIAGAVKVGKTIKDDTFVAGNAGNGSGGRDPKSLYPNSPMN